MHFTRYITLLFVVIITGSTVSNSYGQSWDFEKYPKLDISFQHLDAEIRLHENGLIEGDLLYNFRFNVDGVDSLIFDGTRMDITGLSINNNPAEFSVEKDIIIIYLPVQFESSDSASLRIQYRTDPGFGIHKNHLDTSWSSLLPRSVRHWLPVIDHPRARFTTEMVFTYPSGKTIISNGRKGDSDIVSVEEEVTTFTSSRPLAASSLNWAYGDLELVASTIDNYQSQSQDASAFQRRSDSQIYFYSELPQSEDEELLSVAASAFESVQADLDVRYPFRDLYIVLLEDDKWEIKPYSSGVLYMFRNQGNLETQIRKGVLNQWIGGYITEEQWSDAAAVQLLTAYLANRLFELQLTSDEEEAPYHTLSFSEFSKWAYYLSQTDTSSFYRDLASIPQTLFQTDQRILSWNTLAEVIYKQTGQPYFEIPQPGPVEIDTVDEIEYRVVMDWNEDENSIELNFEALDEEITELVSVIAEEINISGTDQTELTFTGGSDSFILNVSPGVDNVKLQLPSRDDVILREDKPSLFWIYQLRNDESAERRIQAAKALADVNDNPDLQLALTDLLQAETNPEVYAEILRSLSEITMGASGTEQIFLDRISDTQPEAVQYAAIEALSNFTGNEQVVQRLQSIITNGRQEEIQKEAIHSLAKITGPEQFREIVESLVTQESVLPHVPLLLEKLAEKEEIETVNRLSGTFLNDSFPTSIRLRMLDLLTDFDRSSINWEERLPGLLSDRDPRIRYISAEALQFINPDRKSELINIRLVEEYDERVRRMLREME
ncbi:MAG: HEAT repeat domain-containing protein [Balneolaceae bacterium]